MVTKTRSRRPPEEARLLILEAAQELLVAEGPAAVTVRAVAGKVGMTDAGVSHHFGSHQGLLEALLRHGGRQLREDMDAVAARWLDEGARIAPLVDALDEFYRQGYSQLAIALHAAGWRDRGHGMLAPVVEALHEERKRRDASAQLIDTQLAVAALHQSLAVDPAYGSSFRRSVGIGGRSGSSARAQIEWWAETVASRLGLPL